jgi:hypothetical protein
MKYYLPAVKSMVGNEGYRIYDVERNKIAELRKAGIYWQYKYTTSGGWLYSSETIKSDAEAEIYRNLYQEGYKPLSEKLRILI